MRTNIQTRLRILQLTVLCVLLALLLGFVTNQTLQKSVVAAGVLTCQGLLMLVSFGNLTYAELKVALARPETRIQKIVSKTGFLVLFVLITFIAFT